MAKSKNVGIYALEPFSTKNPDASQRDAIRAAATTLATSGFDTVLLASMHVHEDGSIYFNDTLMASGGRVSEELDPSLPQLIRDMKQPGGVKVVLASFGGGGMFNGHSVGYYDFTNIKDLIAKYPVPANNPFFQNLGAVLDRFSIDGLDLDLEVYGDYSPFAPTLVNIIDWNNDRGAVTTICPYESEDFWAIVLETTARSGVQKVAYTNLQNAQPNQIETFISAFKRRRIGVSDLPGFISAGLQCDGSSLSEVQASFESCSGAYPGLRGGWLWNLSSFSLSEAAAYARAVRAGLR